MTSSTASGLALRILVACVVRSVAVFGAEMFSTTSMPAFFASSTAIAEPCWPYASSSENTAIFFLPSLTMRLNDAGRSVASGTDIR